MDTAAINRTALNASATNKAAQVVNLGAASGGVTFIVYDRKSQQFIGNTSTSVSFTALGAVTAVSLIPKATTSVAFSHTAKIVAYRAMYVGNVTTSITFAAAASVDKFPMGKFGSVTTGITATLTAKLARQTFMSGLSELTVTHLARLRNNAQMQGNATLQFSEVARLRNKPFISGNTSVTFTSAATIHNRRRLSGSAGITLSAAADLMRKQRGLLQPTTSGITFGVYGLSTLLSRLQGEALLIYSATAASPKNATVVIGRTGSTITFSPIGVLGKRTLFGLTKAGITFSHAAKLSNNATEPDLPFSTMYRSFEDTTMVRL